jgi:hypothetical protein
LPAEPLKQPVIELLELVVDVLLVLLWLLWSGAAVLWLPMLLGEELWLALLPVVEPLCAAAPLEDVSWAIERLPARHSVAKNAKLFFIE